MNIQVVTPYHNTISSLSDSFINFIKTNAKGKFYSRHSFSHGDCMLYGYAFSQVLDHYKIKYKLCSYICKSKQNGHVFFQVNVHNEPVFFDSENVYSFCQSWKKLQKTYNKVPSRLTEYSSRHSMAKEWVISVDDQKYWNDLIKEYLKLSTFEKICL